MTAYASRPIEKCFDVKIYTDSKVYDLTHYLYYTHHDYCHYKLKTTSSPKYFSSIYLFLGVSPIEESWLHAVAHNFLG